MPSTPEPPESVNPDPMGDDALQDYMSSLFLGEHVDETPALTDFANKTDPQPPPLVEAAVEAQIDAQIEALVEPKSDTSPKPASDSTGCDKSAVGSEIAAAAKITPSHEEWDSRVSHQQALPGQAAEEQPSETLFAGAASLVDKAAISNGFDGVPEPKFQKSPLKRLSAEQIPTDIPLSEGQKRDLQKLLDQKLSLAAQELPTAPAISARPPAASSVIAAAPKNSGKTSDSCQIKAQLDKGSTEPPAKLNAIAASVEAASVELASVETVSGVDDIRNEKHGVSQTPEPVQWRAHWNNQLPDWGQGKFDALLFSARGVTLAIPLIALGHIYLQREPLNQLPGLPSWVIGVKPLSQGSIKVIDAGDFFMPSRPNRLNTDGDLHLLALADSHWAFAVDSVANPISITAEDVQWRPLSDASPWLAGAIKQHMCVLIDTPALLKLLAR